MVFVYGNSPYFLPLFVLAIFIFQLETGTLGNEALIVTKDKMVYGLGKNVNGCLGIGNKNATLKPQKVEALCGKDIKTFACGIGPHVLALTKEGEVRSCWQIIILKYK